jgi:hypothetical protein
MENENKSNENPFLYPIGGYYGHFTPENLIFNANLQEFAQRVSYLCGLESNGKIAPKEAYQQIKELWQKLKESGKELIKEDNPSDDAL